MKITVETLCLLSLSLGALSACNTATQVAPNETQPATARAASAQPPSRADVAGVSPSGQTSSQAISSVAPSPLKIGDSLPSGNVRMLGVDGRQRSIAEVAGSHGTLVIFTCNHCPWAQAWEGRYTSLGNRFVERGVGVIAINPNDPNAFTREKFERMQRYAAGSGITAIFSDDGYAEMKRRATVAKMQFPYVVDAASSVARSFGATKTPEAYLFDREAKLVYHGAIDDNAFAPADVSEHLLRDALEAVVLDNQPARTESLAVGCAIAFHGDS